MEAELKTAEPMYSCRYAWLYEKGNAPVTHDDILNDNTGKQARQLEIGASHIVLNTRNVSVLNLDSHSKLLLPQVFNILSYDLARHSYWCYDLEVLHYPRIRQLCGSY